MQLRFEETAIPEVRLVISEAVGDERGFFSEVFRRGQLLAAGLPGDFVQGNHSRSARGVLRGLHFQWDPPMGKLMRVTAGRAFLVAVDIRPGSPTLGRHLALELDAASHRQIWAPAGFARGFCALAEGTEVQYLCTAEYNACGESGIRWNDPQLQIAWPVARPVVSPRDQAAPTLAEWLRRPEAAQFAYRAQK